MHNVSEVIIFLSGFATFQFIELTLNESNVGCNIIIYGVRRDLMNFHFKLGKACAFLSSLNEFVILPSQV